MNENIEAIRIHWLAQNEAITRIRELHKPYWNESEFCQTCELPYPCPTVKALDGEM